MNRPYTWTRSRALLLALRDTLRFRHRYCKAKDWNVTPRAFCVKDRDHGGDHDDGNGHTWPNHDDRPVTDGHVVLREWRRR